MKRALPLGISISMFCVALFLATAFGEAAGRSGATQAQAGPAGAGGQTGEAATPRRGDGLGLIGYENTTTGDLKVAHCSNAFCVPYVRRR